MMDTKRLKKTILLLADTKALQKERNKQKEREKSGRYYYLSNPGNSEEDSKRKMCILPFFPFLKLVFNFVLAYYKYLGN